MTEWRQITLRDVGTVQSGFAFKSRDWAEAGVPVVKIQNVRGGRVDLTDCSFVPQTVAARVADRYGLSRGDVLVTMSGEIGSVGIVCSDTDILLNQRVGRVRLNETDPVLLRFIGYALQRPELKSLMANIAYGVAQPNISPSLLESLPLQLPPRDSQRMIGEVLRTIDDLIENNRSRVEVLEEMARTIYREWFVHFRYPGHEHVPLVDSPLGPIPHGWQRLPFSAIANFINGFAFKPAHWGTLGRPIIKIKELKNGVMSDTPRCVASEIDPKYWVEPGDLLFSWSADLGIYRWFGEPGLLNQHLFVVTARGDLSAAFLQHALNEAMPQFWDRAQGTTMRHIKRSALTEVSTLVPPTTLVEAFTNVAEPLVQETLSLFRSARTLVALHDLLLPKLVTGQIDVSHLDLDALTEEATA